MKKEVWNKGKRTPHFCNICGTAVFMSKHGSYPKLCGINCLRTLRARIAKDKGYLPPSRLGERVKTAKHRKMTAQGYIELYEGDGKYATRQLEHRKVMEEFIGRKLERREHVHHLNGDKADNRIENLRIMDIREHGHIHGNGRSYRNAAY